MEQEQAELNIDSGVESIASDLGLGSGEATETEDTGIESEVPAETQETEETAAAAPETQSPAPRPAPKAWAKEQHERWSKLDKDTQDYIEHREKQMLEGLSQYSEKARRAEEFDGALKDYMPIIQAQNIKPVDAVRYLFDAHKQLSVGTVAQKQAYLAKIAQSYGIPLSGQQGQQEEEPASVRELRERTERLERERQQELETRRKEASERVTKEVTAFADAKDEKGNPKHPYFDECAEDIVALLQAGHTLEQAYEKAIWANPVTRAKETNRLKEEQEAALRAKAKKEAEEAKRSRSTNVNSKDTRRAPTASKTGNWEDSLVVTLQDIKQRQAQ